MNTLFIIAFVVCCISVFSCVAAIVGYKVYKRRTEDYAENKPEIPYVTQGTPATHVTLTEDVDRSSESNVTNAISSSRFNEAPVYNQKVAKQYEVDIEYITNAIVEGQKTVQWFLKKTLSKLSTVYRDSNKAMDTLYYEILANKPGVASYFKEYGFSNATDYLANYSGQIETALSNLNIISNDDPTAKEYADRMKRLIYDLICAEEYIFRTRRMLDVISLFEMDDTKMLQPKNDEKIESYRIRFLIEGYHSESGIQAAKKAFSETTNNQLDQGIQSMMMMGIVMPSTIVLGLVMDWLFQRKIDDLQKKLDAINEKAAAEAAEEAGSEAAERGAKKAASEAAGEAGSEAAKRAAKKVASEAAGEAAEVAAKKAAQQAAKRVGAKFLKVAIKVLKGAQVGAGLAMDFGIEVLMAYITTGTVTNNQLKQAAVNAMLGLAIGVAMGMAAGFVAGAIVTGTIAGAAAGAAASGAAMAGGSAAAGAAGASVAGPVALLLIVAMVGGAVLDAFDTGGFVEVKYQKIITAEKNQLDGVLAQWFPHNSTIPNWAVDATMDLGNAIDVYDGPKITATGNDIIADGDPLERTKGGYSDDAVVTYLGYVQEYLDINNLVIGPNLEDVLNQFKEQRLMYMFPHNPVFRKIKRAELQSAQTKFKRESAKYEAAKARKEAISKGFYNLNFKLAMQLALKKAGVPMSEIQKIIGR